MLIKPSAIRKFPKSTSINYSEENRRLPSSVKSSISPKLLKTLKPGPVTPKKRSKPSKSKDPSSIIYFSRRFSQVKNNLQAFSLKQIKTIPDNLKKVKNKLSTISNFITQEAASIKNYEDFLTQSLQSLQLVKKLPPVDLNQLKEKKVSVNRKPGFENKKTLIFDLDETLVHCCVLGEEPEVLLDVRLPNGQVCEAGVNLRPFVFECLEKLSRVFEIFVFTASHRCYADVVCDFLDPEGKIFHGRFYRESCIVSEGLLVKDLRIFKNRKIKDIVLVDNSLHCAAYQIDNCVPIVSWFSDRDDKELVKLVSYLEEVEKVDDVRVANRKFFNLSRF